jgi:hypothetical protein
VDRRPEHGRCRLTKGRGGRCFRRRAAACCGVLLAHLRVAGWSGSEGDKEGVRVCFPLFLHVSRSWVGVEGAGARPRWSPQHGYRARANWNSDGHSSFIFPKFCPPGVRSNARKNSNFEFLKNSNWSCQGIQQGFQKYFCCAER